jgi:hypothetical protein
MGRSLAEDLLAAGGEAVLDRILDDRPEQASPFHP